MVMGDMVCYHGIDHSLATKQDCDVTYDSQRAIATEVLRNEMKES